MREQWLEVGVEPTNLLNLVIKLVILRRDHAQNISLLLESSNSPTSMDEGRDVCGEVVLDDCVELGCVHASGVEVCGEDAL